MKTEALTRQDESFVRKCHQSAPILRRKTAKTKSDLVYQKEPCLSNLKEYFSSLFFELTFQKLNFGFNSGFSENSTSKKARQKLYQNYQIIKIAPAKITSVMT